MRQVYSEFDPRGKIVFQEIEKHLILAPPNYKGRQWRTAAEFDINVEINEYGLRDKKKLNAATSNDIFLVGDSFTFGHGVEVNDRFSNIMETLSPDNLKIYNLGISVSHFLNYQKRLNYAEEKSGSIISKTIVGVCMENDLTDYEKIINNYKMYSPNPNFIIKEWLHQKSCLYNFIAVNFKTNPAIRDFSIKIGLIKDVVGGTEFRTKTERELKSSYQQLEKIIEGNQSLVVLIPSRMIWVEHRKDIALASHENFKNILDIHQIQYLDLKPIFEEYSSDPLHELHYIEDGHWNKKGHEIAAHAIFKEWKRIEFSDGFFKPSENKKLTE